MNKEIIKAHLADLERRLEELHVELQYAPEEDIAAIGRDIETARQFIAIDLDKLNRLEHE